MSQIVCRQCGAGFDVTPALPEVFTCGGCGAEVARPRRAPAARPRQAQHHYREELEAAGKEDKTLISVAIGAGVLVLAGLSFFLFGGGSKGAPPVAPPAPAVSPPVPAPAPAPPPAPAPVETKPAEPEKTPEPEPVAM